MVRSQTEQQQQQQVGGGGNHKNVLLLKVGGSSITGKFLEMKKRKLIERIWIVVQYSPYIHPLDFCVCV
jgi:hypothetical protein